MPDYFNLLSKSISSPSIVYHAGTDKAWQEFEKRSGIHFPTDYKNLINKYGTGGLNNFVWFLTPFVTDENVDFMKKSKQMLDAYKISRKNFPITFNLMYIQNLTVYCRGVIQTTETNYTGKLIVFQTHGKLFFMNPLLLIIIIINFHYQSFFIKLLQIKYIVAFYLTPCHVKSPNI